MQVLVVLCFSLFLIEMSTQCYRPDCQVFAPQRYRRSNGAYKRRDEYDFVRFGKRAEKNAQKKGGYDYVRFGKRTLSNWAL